MKCLFMLRDARGRAILRGDSAEPLFFESKTDAKAYRNRINASLREAAGAADINAIHVARGPDHDLFNHYSFSPQRRRRALSKRAHRTQANMGRPQPQKHAARIERIAPLFRKD